MRPVVPLIFALLVAACGETDTTPVAEVDGVAIPVSTFKTEYFEFLRDTGNPDAPGRREAFLNRLIARRLMVADARDRSSMDSAAVSLMRERIRRRLLVEAWMESNVFDTLRVTQTDLDDLFSRINTRLSASILPAPSRADAQALRLRLDEGVPFETLAAEVFTDPVMAANGGSIGDFGFNELDAAIEETAYSLGVGAVSSPVRTEQGWAVIRLDRRMPAPSISDSEFVAQRRDFVAFVRERKAGEARQRLSDQLLAELGPVIDTGAAALELRRFYGLPADSSGATGARTLVRFNRGDSVEEWTIDDFERESAYVEEGQRRQVQSRADLEAFIQGLVARTYMESEAERLGLDATPSFTEAAFAAMEEWIYSQMLDQVASGIAVTEDSSRAIYESNRASFMLPERIALYEIVSDTREVADSIRMAFGSARVPNDVFQQVARNHSQRPSSLVGGYVGRLSREQIGGWADEVFAASENTIIGPYAIGDRYVLLQPGRRTASGLASYDEARSGIEASIRRQMRPQVLSRHIESLYERYPVTVQTEVLSSVSLPEERS